MASDTSIKNEDSKSSESPDAIRLHIPSRYLLLTTAGAATGLAMGFMRGGRKAAWRFLAENAHRPPTTLQGWYFYKKTKNYRVMWGALKEGGAEAAKLGTVGLGWAAMEDGMDGAGAGDVREVGAGLGTAAVFSAIYRLPWIAARRAAMLGLGVGGLTSGLRWARRRLGEEAERRGATAGEEAGGTGALDSQSRSHHHS